MKIELPEPTLDIFGKLPELRLVAVISDSFCQSGEVLEADNGRVKPAWLGYEGNRQNPRVVGIVPGGYGEIAPNTPFWMIARTDAALKLDALTTPPLPHGVKWEP